MSNCPTKNRGGAKIYLGPTLDLLTLLSCLCYNTIMPKDISPTMVYLPRPLKEWLRALAFLNKSSMSSEIKRILENYKQSNVEVDTFLGEIR